MEFSYSPDQQMLRREIVAFARAKLNAGVIERDRDQVFPRALWKECGTMGLTGLPVPEELGGSGLDPLSVAMALEALGYGCTDSGLVFSLCAHIMASVVSICRFGDEEQKRRWLPGLSDGTLVGVNAMTEPGTGSDPFAMRARAVKVADGWRVNAAKTFISNAPEADVIILFAVTDAEKRFHGGITAFLLDRRTPGVSVGRKIEKMGLRTSPFSELVFDDVQLPDSAVLGGVGGGAGVFTHSMDWERICLFAAHVGQMERLTESAIRYARTREAGGKLIGKYQAVSHKIADMKVRLEAARLLTYQAASKLEKTRAVSLDAAMTKLFVSESLVKTAADTLQIFGGYGYTVEYEIERAVRDAYGAPLYSGTSEVQRNIIASWLGL
jgi:alkylation response protein AidB-like acyl-CoA dehydrogenase